MVTAVSLCVGTQTLVVAMGREAVRLMRDMGFNILVLPGGTRMSDFWSAGSAEQDMPQEYVEKLANSRAITVQHLVARLQRKVQWRDRSVLLTGVLPVAPTGHRAPMIQPIPRGQVHVGYGQASALGVRPGDVVTFPGPEGRSFVVAEVPDEPRGSVHDIRICGHLADVQEALGLQGRINEIQALSCMCEGGREMARLGRIREELQSILPAHR